jgi:hypothetical protein
MTREEQLRDEERRARELRMTVDFTASLLLARDLTRAEGEALVAACRARALALFPGKEGAWDLILAPRFARLLQECTLPSSG